MKAFTNANPRDLQRAVTMASQAASRGQTAAFAGGGSDLMGMVKERLVSPDVVINLKALRGQDQITGSATSAAGLTLGGLATLDTVAHHAGVRQHYGVLAEAAEGVATPQIRNVATLAGNVCQRPWCWYFRNGFPCFKNGGSTCFSVTGENQFNAIFGGGPSYIVHPSDTAPALIALDARFRVVGPAGERVVPASEFFILPRDNSARENVLANGELLADIYLPRVAAGMKSTYLKILDREAWTHAVVSAAVVLEMDTTTRDICRRARIVLGGVAPIPWRLTDVEKMLTGQRMTPALAAQAGEASVVGARPLARNGYKIPLTKGVVERALTGLVARA